MERRTDMMHSAWILVLGLPFHALMLLGIADSTGLAGSRDTLSRPGSITLLAVVALTALTVGALWIRRARLASATGTLTALLPLPLYLLLAPGNWALCCTGVVAVLLQVHTQLAAAPEMEGDRDADGDAARAAFPVRGLPATDFLLLTSSGSAIVALLVAGHEIVTGPFGLTAAWSFLGLALVTGLPPEIALLRPTLRRGPYLEYALLILAVGCALNRFQLAALALVGMRQFVVGVRVWKRERGGALVWRHLSTHPAQLLVLSFAAAIVIGTILLALPAATPAHVGLSAIDALFTATSATCVTGLVVLDTGKDFSFFGQSIILGLIQIGGLGIMTISVFFALLLGRQIGLQEEFAIGAMIGEEKNRTALRLIRFIVLTTVGVELVGAGLLYREFSQSGIGGRHAIHFAVFHSVSAFCNAGFALFSDSFEGFAASTGVPLILSVLIILGGLGFGVLYSFILFRFRRRRRAAGAHVRLVLITSGILTFGGALLLWVLERGGAFRDMTGRQALVNAWFQSVTARTAGFNTVDLNCFSPAANALLVVLMFIGAAPGSTGGGVKVTTVAVLFLLVRTMLTERNRPVVGGRSIEPDTIINAAALSFLAACTVAAGGIFLVATQPLPAGKLLFEAFSAFGTVGLSLGVTPHLALDGKLMIIALMFVGRVGPLTLLVMMRPRRRSGVEYPPAKVMIG